MRIITVNSITTSGQCLLEYVQQPPSTTLNCCNPIDKNGFITIVLECIVRHQINGFEIRWFRKNTTGAVENLGLGDRIGPQGNMHWFSLYHDSDFLNQQYNSSFLGKYWCQVINTTANPDQPLMRSNVFTLLAPENYTQPTCASQGNITQTMKPATCADLPVGPVHSEQTTLPAPTTTLRSNENCCRNLPNCKTTSNIAPFQPTVDPAVLPVIAGVCAVVLLLIVCSSLIVILIVIHQKKRRKNYSTSKETG